MRQIILGLMLISFVLVQGQSVHEVVNSSGNTATLNGSNGNLSYSVGQVGYISFTGSNGSMSSGFQQRYEISITTIPEAIKFSLEATIYPNPTTDVLVLSLQQLDKIYNYQIMDFSGKQISTGKLNTPQTQLNFSKYSAGSYYIKIFLSNNQIIKTFKVIKNK
jgi:hypothetical protein